MSPSAHTSFAPLANATGLPWTEVPAGPSYVNDASTISYTLTPGSPVKNFIRLRVTQAP